MYALWHVLWSDLRAAAWFIATVLFFALVASAAGTIVGGLRRGTHGWRPFVRSIFMGAAIGLACGMVLAMLLELAFELERSGSRQHLRDYAGLALGAAAIGAAFIGAQVHARRASRPSPDEHRRRTFTLRQLFAAQLAMALLFGWWVFTRRDEIGQRKSQLDWESRDRAIQSMFEPFGWEARTWTRTWTDSDVVLLSPTFTWSSGRQQPAHDEALELVARQGQVAYMGVSSDAITDRGLQRLATAVKLRDLSVGSLQITDAGITSLGRLPNLRYLRVRSPQVTGACLQTLVESKTIECVVMEGTKITDDEAEAFRQARPDVRLDIVP